MKVKIDFELDLLSLGIGLVFGLVPFWIFATTPDITELKSTGTGIFAAALFAGGIELLKYNARKKK